MPLLIDRIYIFEWKIFDGILIFQNFIYIWMYKYSCQKVFYFIGYVKWNDLLYNYLTECWFNLIFKETSIEYETIKWNVDAEMIMSILLEIENYDRALLVTSDWDFACIVKYLIEKNKFLCLITPAIETCARILKKRAAWRVNAISRLQKKLHTL